MWILAMRDACFDDSTVLRTEVGDARRRQCSDRVRSPGRCWREVRRGRLAFGGDVPDRTRLDHFLGPESTSEKLATDAQLVLHIRRPLPQPRVPEVAGDVELAGRTLHSP